MNNPTYLEIDDDGVITFPPELLKAAGWFEGTVLEWSFDNEAIIIKTIDQD